MPKQQQRRRQRLRTKGDEYFGLLGGWIVGYVAAEGVLRRYMHPLHWVAALVIGLLGYAGVRLWYYWRYVYQVEQERARREG